MQFCGLKCQREAWMNGHKEICSYQNQNREMKFNVCLTAPKMFEKMPQCYYVALHCIEEKVTMDREFSRVIYLRQCGDLLLLK